MEHWNNSNIIFLSTEHRNMNINILNHYLHSSFQKPSDYFLMTSIYFPFVSDSLLAYFFESYLKSPLILLGEIPYGKDLLPKVQIKNEKGIFSPNGKYNFLFLTFMDEYDFRQIFSIHYPVDICYFYCVYFKVVILPSYYYSFDISIYPKRFCII